MDSPDKKFSELVGIVKSWVARRTEPAYVSRDFWMPDYSCRVCYECDSQFTIFNRRHHCRLCGRVFCAKCTTNTIPVPSVELKSGCEESESDRVRVCNYCFKQWEQEVVAFDNGSRAGSPTLSPSPSTTSFVSTKSSGTGNSSSSTAGSVLYSTGPYQRVPHTSDISPSHSAQMDSGTDRQDTVPSRTLIGPTVQGGDPSPKTFGFCMNRSDDDDDEYITYRSDTERRRFAQSDDYYGPGEFDEILHEYESIGVHPHQEVTTLGDLSNSPVNECLVSQELEGVKKQGEEVEGHNNVDEGEAAASIYGADVADSEPVDFENNGLLWLPPEPEDEEDEREALLFDDDEEDATGEWSYLRSSSSFGSGEYRKDRSGEEHKKAMKNVVDDHFRALVAQLLEVENLPVGEEDHKEGWLEIITSLSWEAATLLKPDTSKGGGMDPGGYVKVKCLACGRRSESMVVKGVVCKKNVAHRRMTSKIVKPRFLILGGALEYQRVSNNLSSFDTLLQQEMDHLKMAVAKINSHHPSVLLVEKSVSRYAQEYLLAKDISLVLNIKRPLLERIARCTGAQIVPSIDHLSSQKLGYCDMFHVEKFLEEHGSAGQGGKKLVKTLMFFDGCPKPLGYTILLKGANGDELKKVKHVVQYGVFAAYHLALETSFLADEGASLPELPLKSPITVALPDKPSNIGRSISTIPGFIVSPNNKVQGPQLISESERLITTFASDSAVSNHYSATSKPDLVFSPCLLKGSHLRYTGPASSFNSASFSSLTPPELFDSCRFCELPSYSAYDQKNKEQSGELIMEKDSRFDSNQDAMVDHLVTNGFGVLEASNDGAKNDSNVMVVNQPGTRELPSLQQDGNIYSEEPGSAKEEFPPSPSDHQSILVSLSTRCVWKGTVCERAHLFRIKYYGSFDRPLGRFLRDHLFDQSFRCRSCDMPSEAHVHCYTHRQGSLTISVKKLPEFLLPGEREEKIWMWHRCLRCPRTDGFPPATRRVVMSDAAWGLSFGKFLELSFSNHAAASRVASCGHSLHRDCLRFYGFGRMVACFRYASIDVHSVYLPPSKLEFNYEVQKWIESEANEVVDKARLLFTEVLNTLCQISEKKSDVGLFDGSMKVSESRLHIAELKATLQKEKAEFEESLHKSLNKEVRKGQPVIDILEINRLRRQLLLHCYIWDRRLISASSSGKNHLQEGLNRSMPRFMEKPKLVETPTSKHSTGFTSSDSSTNDAKSHEIFNQGGVEDSSEPGSVHHGKETDQESNHGKEGLAHLSSFNLSHQSDILVSGTTVRRAISEGQFPIEKNLSDTLDAAWTGENHSESITSKEDSPLLCDATLTDRSIMEETASGKTELEEHSDDQGVSDLTQSHEPALSVEAVDSMDSTSWVQMPFMNFYHSFNKNSSGSTAISDLVSDYNPVYVSLFRELERQGGGRLLLPVGVNETVVPVYDDEPTSIISYALVSRDYHVQMSDEYDKTKDSSESSFSLSSYDLMNLHLLHSFDEVKYTVTCYCAKRFEALRRICCPSELDFIRSLSRCKKWGAQGGKSNAFFAKSLDDRFIIKQVTKTELESFIKFAPAYFKYLSESISSRSPTCLAKILGIYQVTSKHLKGGKEVKMDVLVMENLLFQRNVTRLYDLKGSLRSRYNPDSSGSNKVLLDQNLIEAMPTSPIFVGNKAKRLLERAVWNDTAFLASIDVMDYSLLVGVDEEKHELVLGIIDFMRQYTWDKHLETWVKASGILGGPKNASPTVISPKQYKKRFRKAMSAYFLVVPDQWSPPTIVPSGSQSDLAEENTQGGNSVE